MTSSGADPAGTANTVAEEYRRHRRSVFAGIFLGYAAYYLVRNNLALAIPDILAEHPEYSKADLGWALTGLSISYGISKFLMGSVSDRSNPKYFLPIGLLLSCAIMFTSGVVKSIYASLWLVVTLQVLNGWVQGMGWPPCGKVMVHWFSTKERGLVVSVWNASHNVGGGLVATFALFGVMIFGDWGAKLYFNAGIAAVIGVVAFLLLRDTPRALGLPPVEEYRNDYPPDFRGAEERTFSYREIFFGHVLNNRYLWAIAVANAFVYFVRYGVVNWIPTYLQTAIEDAMVDLGRWLLVHVFRDDSTAALEGRRDNAVWRELLARAGGPTLKLPQQALQVTEVGRQVGRDGGPQRIELHGRGGCAGDDPVVHPGAV